MSAITSGQISLAINEILRGGAEAHVRIDGDTDGLNVLEALAYTEHLVKLTVAGTDDIVIVPAARVIVIRGVPKPYR